MSQLLLSTGSISSAKISEDMRCGSMFVITPSERKSNVAKTLFHATDALTANSRSLANAVETSIGALEKNGYTQSFDIAFYSVSVHKERLRFDMCPDVKCDRYKASDLPELVKYDVKYQLAERPVFLDQYLCPAVATAFIARRDDVIVGYGCVHPVGENTFQAGPVFADGDKVGELLLNSLFNVVSQKGNILLLCAKNNQKTEDVLKKHDFRLIEKYFRMNKGKIPAILFDNVYAMTDADTSLI